MGILRLILAAAVVISHSAAISWFPLVNGGVAVKLFFMVSGFYMAMVLSEKYQGLPKGRWLFYSNRFLRIFPIYWLVLAVELLVGWFAPAFATNGGALALHGSVLRSSGAGAFGALVGTEVCLLGNEIFSLFAWLPGNGLDWWTTQVPPEALRGWRLVVMPHAWTLGCEVAFYLIAPWLNLWRSRWMAVVIGVNLLAIAVLPRFTDFKWAEVATDYWAPLQMGFFVLGMLVWRWGKTFPHLFSGWIGRGSILLLFVALFSFERIVLVSTRGALVLLFAAAACALPALFKWSKTSVLDRRLGDLSFPVYLSHLLAVRFFHQQGPSWFPNTNFLNSVWFPALSILSACVIAFVLTRVVELPLDRFRQARLGRVS